MRLTNLSNPTDRKYHKTYPHEEKEHPCLHVSSGIYYVCIDNRPIYQIKTDVKNNDMVLEESKRLVDVAIESYLGSEGKFSIHPTPYRSVVGDLPKDGKTLLEHTNLFKGLNFDFETMVPCIVNMDTYQAIDNKKGLFIDVKLPNYDNEIKFNIWDSALIKEIKEAHNTMQTPYS